MGICQSVITGIKPTRQKGLSDEGDFQISRCKVVHQPVDH